MVVVGLTSVVLFRSKSQRFLIPRVIYILIGPIFKRQVCWFWRWLTGSRPATIPLASTFEFRGNALETFPRL